MYYYIGLDRSTDVLVADGQISDLYPEIVSPQESENIVDILYEREGDLWRLPSAELTNFNVEHNSNYTEDGWNIEVISMFEEEGKTYLVTRAVNDEFIAHVYGTIIGLHVIGRLNDGVVIHDSEPVFTSIGSFGTFAPELVEPIRLSEDVVGFKFESGFTGQGYTTGGIVIYGYTEGGYRELLVIPDAYFSNEGAVTDKSEVEEQKMELSVIPLKGDWYKLKATTVTSKYIDGNLSPVSEQEKVYEYTDGVYIEKQ